jgi:hypothetical protein
MEYRMSHLSFQEYFAASAIVQRYSTAASAGGYSANEKHQINSGISSSTSIGALLGLADENNTAAAFKDTRWQMVLVMAADLLLMRGEGVMKVRYTALHTL